MAEEGTDFGAAFPSSAIELRVSGPRRAHPLLIFAATNLVGVLLVLVIDWFLFALLLCLLLMSLVSAAEYIGI